MAIGRFRTFDLVGDEPLQEFFRRQRSRIAKQVVVARATNRRALDPGGAYTLTIRGVKPAQIALESPPEDILKRSGEIGYRQKAGTFLSGS